MSIVYSIRLRYFRFSFCTWVLQFQQATDWELLVALEQEFYPLCVIGEGGFAEAATP